MTAGTNFKIFNHLLKIASDNFSYLLNVMLNLLSHFIYIELENETNSFSVCVDKIYFKSFLKAHFGYLKKVDPDQPASSEAD